MRAYIERRQGFVENKSSQAGGLAMTGGRQARCIYDFHNLTFGGLTSTTRGQSYTYLADSAIGLRKYERMTDTVGVLVENASSYSYAKAAIT